MSKNNKAIGVITGHSLIHDNGSRLLSYPFANFEKPLPVGTELYLKPNNNFKFDLGDFVEIEVSGEEGKVIGRAEYLETNNSYYIRYMNANEEAVEKWWGEDALSFTGDINSRVIRVAAEEFKKYCYNDVPSTYNPWNTSLIRLADFYKLHAEFVSDGEVSQEKQCPNFHKDIFNSDAILNEEWFKSNIPHIHIHKGKPCPYTRILSIKEEDFSKCRLGIESLIPESNMFFVKRIIGEEGFKNNCPPISILATKEEAEDYVDIFFSNGKVEAKVKKPESKFLIAYKKICKSNPSLKDALEMSQLLVAEINEPSFTDEEKEEIKNFINHLNKKLV